MITFNQFRVNEAESSTTKLDQLRLDLSKKFDEISDAKALKKQGDVNSEVQSIDKQAAIYVEVVNIMKALSVELKKSTTGGTPPKSNY